jgi:UDP-N-acetyl-D-glucosamine dehydrogenase
MIKDQLLSRIESKQAKVAVIGLGYVGLPLSVEFARAGYHVLGYDVNEKTVAALNQGRSHIQDVASADVAAMVRSGMFEATSDGARLSEVDAISVAVPTPLSKTRDPDMTFVQAASAIIAQHARPGMLVILESTTYPGTTREVLMPMFVERGFEIGTDLFLAFSPERVDPGNPVYHTRNTPKVVGGITPACTELAVALYSRCVDTVVPVSSTETAELVKLLENTFRSVNIGLVNEMAFVCDRLGVDVWEVIEAAATKPFGFMKFSPGPGIGGHCIPLDPHYLAWKMRSLNYKTRFIDLASEINIEMPAFIATKVAQALNRDRKSVNGSRILVLGVAYKRDIDDVRESPALDIIRLLESQGAEVVYHDPHVPAIRDHDERRDGIPLSPATLGSADCVVIVTDHSVIDYQMVVDHAALVVDTRNALAGISGNARVVALSEARLGSPMPAGAGAH